MHVIWKRPDGFHDADPSDFAVVDLGGQSRIWLHKRDYSNFPFRIAGGWQESEATKRLNNLVNLISQPDQTWTETLLKIFNDSMGEDAGKFVDDIRRWVTDLRSHLKGDTWELDIMNQALTQVEQRLATVRSDFIARAGD